MAAAVSGDAGDDTPRWSNYNNIVKNDADKYK